MHEIQNVLVPTDFTDGSKNALRTAIEICKRQNATLTQQHVKKSAALLLMSFSQYFSRFLRGKKHEKASIDNKHSEKHDRPFCN